MLESARKLAVIIAIAIAMAAHGASAAPEFYTNLLRRGISEFNAGRYASATTLLKTAAFGLIDAIDQFETAQAYVAVASQRLGREEDARHAARRIMMAERIQRRFAALPLPAELRTEFQTLAKLYLTPAENAALTDANAVVPARPGTTTVQRRPLEPQTPTPAEPAKPAASTVPPPQVAAIKPPPSTPRTPDSTPATSDPSRAALPPVAVPTTPPPAAAKTDEKPAATIVREPEVVVETVEVAPPQKREEPTGSKPPNLVEEAPDANATKPQVAAAKPSVAVASPAETTPAPQKPLTADAPATPKVEPVTTKTEPAPKPAETVPTETPKPAATTTTPVVPVPAEPKVQTDVVAAPPAKPLESRPVEPKTVQPEPIERKPEADPEPAVVAPPAAPQPTTVPPATQPAASQPEPRKQNTTKPAEPTTRTTEPPVKTAAPAPDPVREAQREFERKVVEVEREQAEAPARAVATRDVEKVLDEAGRAIDQNDIAAARAALRSVLANKELKRPAILRVAEESYRARDFRLAVEAFERAGRLQPGEEPLGYYLAVAFYETGRYREAKAALRDALPFIELTDDIARYRAKIEGALD